jgi:hypothetical protein
VILKAGWYSNKYVHWEAYCYTGVYGTLKHKEEEEEREEK